MTPARPLPTLTVGIPAYNEEANVGYLIEDILKQEEDGFRLEKILVYSDGSTDRTNEIVRSFDDPRVQLLVGPGRLGIASGQNAMIEICESDCLVLVNADIQLTDGFSFAHLARPILLGRADLTSAYLETLPPRTFFERVLQASAVIKTILFEADRGGNNLYTCRGPGRALSRRFYTAMRFPRNIGEDAYSYLACLALGFTYEYVREAVVLYRLPSTFSDHRKQSLRFFNGQMNFVEEFGRDFVKQHLHIPLIAYARGVWRAAPYLAKHPLEVATYVLVVVWLRVEAIFTRSMPDIWVIAESSKQLR